MVANDGRIKVLDFGLVRDLRGIGDEDATRASAGETPGRDGGGDSRLHVAGADRRRTGRPSHRHLLAGCCAASDGLRTASLCGASSPEKMSSILRDAPEPLTVLRPDMPLELARIVRRCLEKDPRRRMQSARDVANKLRDLSPACHFAGVVPGHGHASLGLRSNADRKAFLERIDSAEDEARAGQDPGESRAACHDRYCRHPRSRFVVPATAAAHPRITGYTPITNDGRTKLLAGTDGSRVYFTLSSPNSIAEVGVTGGEIVQVPVEVTGADISLVDVSPDGSSFLVNSGGRTATGTIWNVPHSRRRRSPP